MIRMNYASFQTLLKVAIKHLTMVTEQDLIRHFKYHIKRIEGKNEIFKAKSSIGTLNRQTELRKWWLDNFPSHSDYLAFFIKHRKHFIYNQATGQITLNTNPFVKPVVFDALLQFHGMKQAMKHVNKIHLLIQLFEYLKAKPVIEPIGETFTTGLNDNQSKMRGELGVSMDELMLRMAEVTPNPLKFLTDEEPQLPTEFKSFVREFKGVINLNGPMVYFDDSVIYMAEEAEKDIQELAKNAVRQLIEAFLKENELSGAKKYPLENLATFLNQRLAFLATVVVDGQAYDSENLRQLLENDERFRIVNRSQNAFDIMLASLVKEISPSGQLYNKKGEVLRDLVGKVTSVRQERIVFEIEYEFGKVEFTCKSNEFPAGLRRLKCGDEVKFSGRYNKNDDLWEATKIKSIAHKHLPPLPALNNGQEEAESV